MPMPALTSMNASPSPNAHRPRVIAEIPAPGSDLAGGFVLEGQQPAIHVEDLERPVGVDGLLKLRLQWHQAKGDELIGISVHMLRVREIPESLVVFLFRTIVV